MKETIRVLLSEEEVDRRIKEVADQITAITQERKCT